MKFDMTELGFEKEFDTTPRWQILSWIFWRFCCVETSVKIQLNMQMRWYFCIKATKPLQPTREISFLKKAFIFHSFTLHWTIKKPMVTRGLIKESMKEGLIRGKYARTSEELSKPKILLIWYLKILKKELTNNT